ncbi:hypothetical protein OEA41_000480 [Lepraria neglecta]|uniref:Uncharacterized protein n=1 Tax=Lepraria neglecta TaxID=209136 RepID=A0AAE0DPU1_9LECA|nr:hypothetical protein OEA41_000480 [Lepraria neglecta]
MPCGLIELQAELQLKIIEELSKDEVRGDDVGKQDDRFKIHHDLMNWSCTSAYYRDSLAPYIFKTVILRNDEKSGCSLNALASSRHSECVEELHFVGSAPGNAKEGRRHSQTLVEFAYHFDDWDQWEDGLDLCAEVETEEQVKAAEEEEAWRALMAKTYDALLRNQGIHFKTLDINQLVLKKVYTFNSKLFHDFLSHFERFTLSIRGEDNGAGWKSNKSEEYHALISGLDECFFDHLASVTTLIIKAPKEGPLGLEGMNHARLALKKDQMPLLKAVHLEHVFICPELIDFLVGHSKTLERLSLNHCFGGVNGLAENGIHWKQLFDTVYNANPEKLRQIEILPIKLPLTDAEVWGAPETETEISEEVRDRQILETDSSRRVFAYTTLDDKYGMLFQDEEENLASFLRGEDQASYERLEHKINQNAKKCNA